MTDMPIADGSLDIREKLAHIDLMLAQHDRVRQEMRYAPFLAVIGGITGGAALFAAAFAFAKLYQ
jgi:hypothetical protein